MTRRIALYTVGLLITFLAVVGGHVLFLLLSASNQVEHHDIDIGVQVDYPNLSQLNPEARAKIEKVIFPYIQNELDAYWEVIETRNVLNHPYYPNDVGIDESFVMMTQGQQTPLAHEEIQPSLTSFYGDVNLVTIRLDQYWQNTNESEPEIDVATFVFDAETGVQYPESAIFLNSNMHTRKIEDWENSGYLTIKKYGEDLGITPWLSGETGQLRTFVITQDGILVIKSLAVNGMPGKPNELLIPFEDLAPQLNPCGPLRSLSSKKLASDQRCPSQESISSSSQEL